MNKIPVFDFADVEGNIDANKLVEALVKGGVTLYGMNMLAIRALRHDYLQRGGSMPITEKSVAALTRPKAVALGCVLVELDAFNNLCGRLNALIDAGSADAKSLAADAALLLEARRG